MTDPTFLPDPAAGIAPLDRLPADAESCDVLVVGAGASGIPAALAAARAGARVVLLEEDAVPGGAPVDNYVSMLCGGPRVGIYREISLLLNAEHNLPGAPVAPFDDAGEAGGRDYWYLPSSYLQVLLELLAAEPQIDLVCGAPVTGVAVRDAGGRRRVLGVVTQPPGAPARAYAAPVVIDATGTGLVAALAGCATQYGRNARADFAEAYGPDHADQQVQPCTWMFVSQRLRPGALLPEELVGSGMVESNHGWVHKTPDSIGRRHADAYLHWGATVACADTRDPRAVAAAQREAMGLLVPKLDALRRAGYATHLAPKLGVREVRRVLGEAVVTATDLLAGRFPADTIAHCAFFLDAWGEHDRLPRTPVHAGIPYGALVPRGTEGLLLAGKAISGTHLAMSAYRVQPIMGSVGEAAGIAAALAAALHTGVREVPLAELQRRLRLAGVLLAERYG